MSFLPHHHHKDVECMVMERCVIDDTFNDEHTAHHAEHESNDNSSCINSAQSLKVKFNVFNGLSTFHYLPLLIIAYNESFSEICLESEPLYYRYKVSYKSPVGRGLMSLRAPPCTIF